MKKPLKEILITWWPQITVIGAVLVAGIGNIIEQQIKMASFQQQMIQFQSSLTDEHKIMKSYVDDKNATITVRIDDLNHSVDKFRYDLDLENQRVDNTLGQIMEMQKEIMEAQKDNNSRLDSLLISSYQTKKR